LNGDGEPDLVTANYSTLGTVSVLLGSSNGTFAARMDYGTGSGPHSAAIADLNGDGRPDLVTANAYSSTVSVLLGSGKGTFATKMDFGTAPSPVSLAIGDLDGNSRIDVVTANRGSPGTVSVLMNSGAVVGVPGNDRRPALLQLGPAQPNPFISTTTIQFSLTTPSRVKLEILDIEGRRVATLIDASLPAGHHAVAWTGRDDHGSIVCAAVYFARLVSPSGTLAGRVVRLR
jgi:hypothetical protein